MTLVNEENSISAHVTDQNQNTRTHVGRISLSDLQGQFSNLVSSRILTDHELDRQVFYFTNKFGSFFSSLTQEFLKQKVSRKEVLSYMDIEAITNSLYSFHPKLRASPSSYMGVCRADRFLSNEEGQFGIIDYGKMIMKIGDVLYQIELPFFNNSNNVISNLLHNLGVKYLENDLQKRLNEIAQIYRTKA